MSDAAVSALKKEDRVLAIRNALDEQINMEMPTLQQNMAIIFTNTTLGTLMGLFGTVLGMIKSFSALSASGAPDSAALSTGISEALVNTASGIATGALAVILIKRLQRSNRRHHLQNERSRCRYRCCLRS